MHTDKELLASENLHDKQRKGKDEAEDISVLHSVKKPTVNSISSDAGDAGREISERGSAICRHEHRTDLSAGNGFRCDDCGAIVHAAEKKEDGPRYQAVMIGGKWFVHDNKLKKEFGKKTYGSQKRAKAKAKELNDEERNLGTKSINLTAEEAERSRTDEKAFEKAQRAEQLKQYDETADKFIVSFLKLKAINEDFGDLTDKREEARRAFKEELKMMVPLFDELAKAFTRLKDDENILGHHSLETLCPQEVGVSASYVRRIRREQHNLGKPAKVTPLLPEGENSNSARDDDNNKGRWGTADSNASAIDAEFEDLPSAEHNEQPKATESEINTPEGQAQETEQPNVTQGHASPAVNNSFVETRSTMFHVTSNGGHKPTYYAKPSEFTVLLATDVVQEFLERVVDKMSAYDRTLILHNIDYEIQDRLNGTKEQAEVNVEVKIEGESVAV